MRKEVMEIVQKIKRRDKQPSSTEALANGYEYVLPEKERYNLEQMAKKQNALITSTQSFFADASVHIGTSTSVEIEWDSSNIEIVIELSLEENLASVFTYGDVPQEALDYVDNCLETNDLVKLSDEEIGYLENEGLYHQIF